MISLLSGQIVDVEEGIMTLLCRGVGYEVHCSSNTLQSVEDKKMAQLWIHTHVREDNISLFGFATKVEKKLFINLIKVNGIGPKLAIQILSGASLEHIINAIETKDIKQLTQLPRVGKKTAEQMVLTLKGVLVTDNEPLQSMALNPHREILSALTHLGFRLPDVELVVSALPQDIDFEQGVRESLRQLSQ
jgi:holliday junction DNA helicase RuvA